MAKVHKSSGTNWGSADNYIFINNVVTHRIHPHQVVHKFVIVGDDDELEMCLFAAMGDQLGQGSGEALLVLRVQVRCWFVQSHDSAVHTKRFGQC